MITLLKLNVKQMDVIYRWPLTYFAEYISCILEIPKIYICPKILQLPGKIIIFMSKSLVCWLLIQIVIKHALFLFSCCYKLGIESMGVTPKFSKGHNFWNFTDIILKKIFMNSYTISHVAITNCMFRFALNHLPKPLFSMWATFCPHFMMTSQKLKTICKCTWLLVRHWLRYSVLIVKTL